jgi:hypothetical protein
MTCEDLLMQLTFIAEAFYLHQDGTNKLKRLNYSSHIVTYKEAYRAIVLTAGVDNYGIQKAQLSMAMIEEPFRSWSKTKAGAKRYFSAFYNDDYVVLVKGSIQGIDLTALAQDQIKIAEKYLDTHYSKNKLSFIETEQKEMLEKKIIKIKYAISRFEEEEEIVSCVVLSFEIDSSGSVKEMISK